MRRIALRGFAAVVLAVVFSTAANAQAAPTGTWKGNLLGSDTGTVIITIDANQKVTATVHSNQFGANVALSGGLTPLGYGFYDVAAQTQGSADPVWVIDARVSAGADMSQGIWSAGYLSGIDGNGSFTADYVSGSTTSGPIALGGYLTGSWYNPTPGQSGHGFEIQFTAQANIVVAYWFAYAPDGKSPSWIYAQGTYDTTKNTVTMPAIILTGGMFPPRFNSNQLEQTPWGTITFVFDSCNAGTVSWNSSVAGYGSGSFPIVRLTSIPGATCPQ